MTPDILTGDQSRKLALEAFALQHGISLPELEQQKEERLEAINKNLTISEAASLFLALGEKIGSQPSVRLSSGIELTTVTNCGDTVYGCRTRSGSESLPLDSPTAVPDQLQHLANELTTDHFGGILELQLSDKRTLICKVWWSGIYLEIIEELLNNGYRTRDVREIELPQILSKPPKAEENPKLPWQKSRVQKKKEKYQGAITSVRSETRQKLLEILPPEIISKLAASASNQ